MITGPLPELTEQERRRYARHLVLPDIGVTGQRKLKAARVLVVGLGGLGSPVSMYLAGAGVGRIGLVDSDVVTLSNLQRQVLHGSSMLDRPKVESARQRLLDLNPDIQVETNLESFTGDSAEGIAADYDLVVDGTDNFATRYCINDICLRLGIPYVYGAIFRLEGQASVLCAKAGPCYRCLYPEPPPAESVMTAEEAGVLGVVPGTIGTIQATETIKWIVGIGPSLVGRLLVYDAREMRFEMIAVAKNPSCPGCGGRT